MRKLFAFLAIAVAVTGAAFGASPAATQSWVRHYVATNSASSSTPTFDTRPSSFAVTNDLGQTERIVLNWESATNLAFRVENSNVAGLTNGTTYAKTASYHYENPRISVLPSFQGQREQFGSTLTGGRWEIVTNGTEIVTNAVYSTTNAVIMTRYTMSVNGVAYKTTEVGQGLHLAKPVNGVGGTFYLRAKLITDAEYYRITTPPPSFSWLDLICPRAYAVELEEKYITGVEEYDTYIRTYYEAHYFTDVGDMKKYTLGSISIVSANGQTMTYELGVELFSVDAGIDICDINEMDVPANFADTIDATVQEIVGRNRYIQLSRSEEYQAEIEKRVREVRDALDGLKRECPKNWYEDENKPEPEPEPEPVPPTPPPEPVPLPPAEPEHYCTVFDGQCGHWRCIECHLAYEAPDETHPATHTFEAPEGGTCFVCKWCGVRDPDETHHFGWHDGNSNPMGPAGSFYHSCICACGHFKLYHIEGDETIEYLPDESAPLVCWRVWRCARCGQVVEPSGGITDNGFTRTATTHAEKGGGKFDAVTEGEREICRLSYVCDHGPGPTGDSLGCGAARTEDFYHVFMENNEVVREIEGDDEEHGISCPCSNGFVHWSDDPSEWSEANTNWCGKVKNDETRPHDYGDWTVMPWDAQGYHATDTQHRRIRVCGVITADGEVKHDSRKTCGHVVKDWEEHDKTGDRYGYVDEHLHDVSNYCQSCRGTFYVLTTNHIETADTYYWSGDNENHAVSNRCGGCDHFFPKPAEAHLQTGLLFYGNPRAEGHDVTNYCTRCHHDHFIRFEPHNEGTPSGEVTPYRRVNNVAHEVSNECFRCGAQFLRPNRPQEHHTRDRWTLLSDEDYDLAWCAGCNSTNEVEHTWVASGDVGHYCANGNGHLRFEDHEYNTDGICIFCRWNRDTHHEEDHPDPPPVYVTNVCANCSLGFNRCYAVYKDGVLDTVNCAAGWNTIENKCGCWACRSGIVGMCACTWSFQFVDGPVDPLDEIMDGSNE